MEITSISLSYLQIVLAILLIILSSLYYNFTQRSSTHNKNHGFKTYPLLGTLPHFLRNRHRFLDWSTTVLATHPTHTSVFFRPGKVHGVMTANPAVVEYILKTNFHNYPKGPRFMSLLHDFLGIGIFNVDEELWKHQRKTASFEFNKRSLKTFLLDTVRSEITTRLILLLQRASAESSPVDMQDVLERFAFDNVCKLAFNVDPCCLSLSLLLSGDGSGCESDFMRAFEEAATLSSGRFMYAVPFLWKIKKFFNIGSEKRLRKSIRIVHEYADKIIRSRLVEMKCGGDENNDYHDLLSRFIESSRDNGLSYSDCNFLRDVVISFILAGRDTTSSGLSWLIWLLSVNPSVLEKIRAEIREVRTRPGKQVGDTYNFDELREMNYLHGVLSETLRLYPPVPVDTRVCNEDDVLPDGTKIQKEWFITYHTYGIGRLQSIWGKDCLEFQPERWIDENGLYKPDNQFRYPVFHAGPRICLGKELAYVQMKSIAACLVEQFDFDVLGKEKRPEILLSLTLRMKNGLPVVVTKREISDFFFGNRG